MGMRPKFETRRILLRAQLQRDSLQALVKNLPLDADRPLEVVIQEQRPIRKPDQNALMWSGPLKDIEEQAWLEGRQFSAKVWHELFKREFLPEVCDEHADQYKDGYAKWAIDPLGERVLIGSTTDLTVKGFSIYLEQVYAFGANLGVIFHAGPAEQRRAA